LPASVVSDAESVAYLGLSYLDMEARLGPAAAARRYDELGRQAFLPLGVFRREFARRRPDLVVATNSPRAERAALEVAGEMGIPSICVVDLFGKREARWLARPGYGRRLCVLSEAVRDAMVAAGRPPEEVVVTGNPAFDALLGAEPRAAGSALRSRRGWGDSPVILWATQPLPREAKQAAYARRVDARVRTLAQTRADWTFVVRRHPSESGDDRPALDALLQSAGEEPLEALLHAVDVVVTMGSTVGLEAALSGRGVVQILGSSYSDDVPYAAEGIAIAASDPDDLERAIERVLDSPATAISGLMCDGRATSRVVDEIDALLMPSPHGGSQ
jgi:hypothetical protein